jgi:hypothetical protein
MKDQTLTGSSDLRYTGKSLECTSVEQTVPITLGRCAVLGVIKIAVPSTFALRLR